MDVRNEPQGLSNTGGDMTNTMPAIANSTEAEIVGPSSILQVIERAALNPNIDVEKMERLLAMHERLAAKDAEAMFNEAMSAVQAKMKVIAKDAKGEKSMYASYPALIAALGPLYTAQGFSLSFDTGDGAPESCVRVLCHVGHKAGHTRTYRADIPADGKGAKGGDVMTKTHATGSAFAYGQRYLVKLIFNVATGELDDDGEAAGGGVPITAGQKEILIDLLKKTASDTARFLAHMRAPSLDELPASRFEEAKAALEKKRGKK